MLYDQADLGGLYLLVRAFKFKFLLRTRVNDKIPVAVSRKNAPQCLCEQRTRRSDCANAQSDLGARCLPRESLN